VGLGIGLYKASGQDWGFGLSLGSRSNLGYRLAQALAMTWPKFPFMERLAAYWKLHHEFSCRPVWSWRIADNSKAVLPFSNRFLIELQLSHSLHTHYLRGVSNHAFNYEPIYLSWDKGSLL